MYLLEILFFFLFGYYWADFFSTKNLTSSAAIQLMARNPTGASKVMLHAHLAGEVFTSPPNFVEKKVCVQFVFMCIWNCQICDRS